MIKDELFFWMIVVYKKNKAIAKSMLFGNPSVNFFFLRILESLFRSAPDSAQLCLSARGSFSVPERWKKNCRHFLASKESFFVENVENNTFLNSKVNHWSRVFLIIKKFGIEMPDTCVHVSVGFKSLNDFVVQTKGSRSQKTLFMPRNDSETLNPQVTWSHVSETFISSLMLLN